MLDMLWVVRLFGVIIYCLYVWGKNFKLVLDWILSVRLLFLNRLKFILNNVLY